MYYVSFLIANIVKWSHRNLDKLNGFFFNLEKVALSGKEFHNFIVKEKEDLELACRRHLWVRSQIAFMCWANVGFPLATLLGQRWQMTLAQWNFAHLPSVGPTSWASVGPMISVNNVYNLLTRCQQMFRGKYGGPTLAQYHLPAKFTICQQGTNKFW